MADEHPVVEAAIKYRAALEKNDIKAINRLIDAYGGMFRRLQDKIDLLVLDIGNKSPTRGQLVRMQRYQELMTQAAQELQGMQALTANELDAVIKYGIKQGASDATGMMSYAVAGSPELSAQFHRLPKDAIETLIGFLDPEGPLYERLSNLASNTVQGISDAMIEGIGLGYNPQKIGREITNAFGMGLTDAMRMVRTAQLWSYREANRATYIANADVVEGWVWHAHLGDNRTCMSCVAMHGSFHGLDETLNDHHNGRCAMIPAVRGFPNPVKETGEDWFSQQDEAKQRAMMGKGKFEAWKEGGTNFNDLIMVHDDPVYGQMRFEAPLWHFLGAEPPIRK